MDSSSLANRAVGALWSRTNARSIGMVAAMIVTTLSAAPQITNSTVSIMSKAPIAAIVRILMKDTAPALAEVFVSHMDSNFPSGLLKHNSQYAHAHSN